MHHSKSSTSMMFYRNTTRNFLPPMVYEYWTRRGPNGTVYDATKGGWFDNRKFMMERRRPICDNLR